MFEKQLLYNTHYQRPFLYRFLCPFSVTATCFFFTLHDTSGQFSRRYSNGAKWKKEKPEGFIFTRRRFFTFRQITPPAYLPLLRLKDAPLPTPQLSEFGNRYSKNEMPVYSSNSRLFKLILKTDNKRSLGNTVRQFLHILVCGIHPLIHSGSSRQPVGSLA